MIGLSSLELAPELPRDPLKTCRSSRGDDATCPFSALPLDRGGEALGICFRSLKIVSKSGRVLISERGRSTGGRKLVKSERNSSSEL